MTAEDYLITHFQAKKMDDNGLYYSKEDVMNAMKEYGKQCYIRGSNDCHKAMIDSLPSEKEIFKEADIAYPVESAKVSFRMQVENAHQGFTNGAIWLIKTIKGE